MVRAEICTAFDRYTSSFDGNNERITLKQLHTYKVAALSDRISGQLALSPQDRELAWLIAMLHDFGRFEQVHRYDTFLDSVSVDHAQFGADLLFCDGLIRLFPHELTQEELALLELAIRQHSVLSLPADLTPRQLLFCNLIRDADKLDIQRVNTEQSPEAIFGITAAALRESEISPAVLQCAREKRCIPKSLRSTPADLMVSHIAMAFELQYPESRRIATEQGYLTKMLNFSSACPGTQAAFRELRALLSDWLGASV